VSQILLVTQSLPGVVHPQVVWTGCIQQFQSFMQKIRRV